MKAIASAYRSTYLPRGFCLMFGFSLSLVVNAVRSMRVVETERPIVLTVTIDNDDYDNFIIDCRYRSSCRMIIGNDTERRAISLRQPSFLCDSS